MNTRRTALSAAILSIIGTLASHDGANAGTVAPGLYDLVILTTQVTTAATASGTISGYSFGADGNWQSSFTFGGGIPGKGDSDPSPPVIGTSQAMTDDGTSLPSGRGSGIAGDGWAGIMRVRVNSNGSLSVSSFSKDVIFGTAGGNFVQYTDPAATGGPQGNTSQFTGTVNLSSGAMTLVPTGRLGAISAFPALIDERWNVDDVDGCPGQNPSNGNDIYLPFSTGSTGPNYLGSAVNGKVFSATPDQNGDGISDFLGVIATGTDIGADWADFTCAQFFEIWRVRLLSVSPDVVSDSASAFQNNPVSINVLANDAGQPALTITSKTNGANGTVAINAGTSITYTPNTGFLGTDSFTYTVTDGGSRTGTATVTVTVSSSPVIANPDTASTNQNQSVTTVNLTTNDAHATGGTIDPTTVQVPATSTKGATLTDNNDGTVTYAPPAALVGTDTFTYTVNDTDPATPQSDPATVTVSVNPRALVSAGIFAPGAIAATAGATNGFIEAADINVPDPDATSSCIGGCADFTVSGIANGSSVIVGLTTLGQGVQAGSTVRRFVGTPALGTWGPFTTDGQNAVASAPLHALGGCPGLTDPSWLDWGGSVAPGGAVNHLCLRFTLQDGGPNDADGASNGTVVDPLGLGVVTQQNQSSGVISEFRENAGGGCTLAPREVGVANRADWGLLTAFLAWLGYRRQRKTSL